VILDVSRGDHTACVESEPVHAAKVARVLDLHAAIHDHVKAAGDSNFRAFLADHVVLQPQAFGANGYGIAREGAEGRDPLDAPIAVYANIAATLFESVVDDLETDLGWTAGASGDTATSGIWTLGDPNGTIAQPEDDHTPNGGTNCWFTGQASSGAAAGTNDVDGGHTTLVTPLIDLADVAEAVIGYWRWYDNSSGAAPCSSRWK